MKRRQSIYYLLIAGTFTFHVAASAECPNNEMGFKGHDVLVEGSHFAIGDITYDNIEDVVDDISLFSRGCPVMVATSENSKDRSLGATLCMRVANLGFETVILRNPGHKGWTLYTPGINCSLSFSEKPDEPEQPAT